MRVAPQRAATQSAASSAVMGSLYAVLFNRLGMPSFVSTLAGLLAVLGLQLYILGSSGSINLPYDSTLVTLGQTLVMPPPVAYGLALLAGVYLYGFTEYGFRMADLERWIENHPVYGVPFFAAAAVALVIFHRRQPRASAVRFDGNEPEIQRLNLT